MDPIDANPQSPPADNAAGPNGVSSPPAGRVTGQDLETALSRLASPDPAEPASPPAPSDAPSDPETPTAPPAEGPPGQETLPAETPAGTTPEGEPETVLSQTDEALATELQALPPDIRRHLLEVAKTKPGEIPRIGKLIAEKGEYVQAIGELQKQVETLQKQVEAGPASAAPGPVALPETVAKLKTIGEVKARTTMARQSVRAIESFLRRNPSGGEINGKTVTPEELESALEGWNAELDALPEREQQIHHTAQFQQARETARTQMLADYPWLGDPENPEVKQFAKTFQAAPALKHTLTPEYWAAVYQRGIKAMQDELAARQGKTNGHAPFGTPPKRGVTPSGIPTGKPSAPAAAAPAKPVTGLKAFQAALPKPGEKVKGTDLERALAALPSV